MPPLRRLFFALRLPDEAIGRIAGIARLAEASMAISGLRLSWVPAAQYHLTLRFLGEVPAADAADLVRDFADFLPGDAAPHFKAARLSLMPDRRRARLLALDLEPEPADAADGLLRDLDDFLAARGFPMESSRFELRRWRAHVTLCRFRTPPRCAGAGIPDFPSVRGTRIVASSIDLVESTLHRSGAEYQTLYAHSFR